MSAGSPPDHRRRFEEDAMPEIEIQAATGALVAERLLLPRDAEGYGRAAEACDRFCA
jgi:hypothetical protein